LPPGFNLSNGNPGVLVQETAGVWFLQVWIQPGAKHNAVMGVLDGCLKIRIAAPAVDNKANGALAAYVAAQLGLRRGQVDIVSGLTGRRKKLRINSKEEPVWKNLFPTGAP
jgi:uncharacterized protein